MGGWICCPTEPKECNWDQPREDDEVGETGFWFWAAEFLDVDAVDVVDPWRTGGGDGHAKTNPEEGESGESWLPVASLLEHDGVGGEIEVEDSPDEG